MLREQKFVALVHSRNQLFITIDVNLTLAISSLLKQNSRVQGAEYVISALTRLYSPPAFQLACIKLSNVQQFFMLLNSLTGMLTKYKSWRYFKLKLSELVSTLICNAHKLYFVEAIRDLHTLLYYAKLCKYDPASFPFTIHRARTSYSGLPVGSHNTAHHIIKKYDLRK